MEVIQAVIIQQNLAGGGTYLGGISRGQLSGGNCQAFDYNFYKNEIIRKLMRCTQNEKN